MECDVILLEEERRLRQYAFGDAIHSRTRVRFFSASNDIPVCGRRSFSRLFAAAREVFRVKN